MKRKLLTTFLALVMLVSSIPSAMAAKKNDPSTYVDPDNICWSWGSFEKEESLMKLGLLQDKGTILSLAEGGYRGGDKCLSINSLLSTTGKGNHDDVTIYFPATKGEIYDISFYARTDTPEVNAVELIMYYSTGGARHLTSCSVTDEWSKFSYTFNYNGKDSSGNEISATEEMNTRILIRFHGTVYYQSYIDEFSIIPKGKVPDADYGSIAAGIEGADLYKDDSKSVDVENLEFSDVKGHWAETVIEDLATYDYINGVGEGKYSPESNLTRAQFIKMVADTYKEEATEEDKEEDKFEYDGRFSDVAGDEWFAEAIVKADSLGLIDDALKVGGKIEPDKAITREEAASIAAKVAKDRGAKPKANAVTSFDDEDKISDWAKESVKKAASFGLIRGYTNGTYKPENKITRAEAAQILFRIVEVDSKMHIYVDAQNGDDSGDGTADSPLKTIAAARDMAKVYAPNMQNNIKVLMRGRFRLNETLKFGVENSGGNGYSIIYTSWGTEKPVITMADEFSGFELHDEKLNIYRTYIGVGKDSRQAYFNDVKGIRARTVGYVTNGEFFGDYWLCDDEYLLDLAHPLDVDMIFLYNYCYLRLLIGGLSKTEEGRIRIDPNANYYKISSIKSRISQGANTPKALPMQLENAYEFLNEKGEYFIDKYDGYLYYIPRTGEDMSDMVVKVPLDENLVEIKGNSFEDTVGNLTFDNLVFEGASWMRPTVLGGHNASQNNHVAEAGYSASFYTTQGAVHAEQCRYITFTKNTFRQIGTTALTVINGSKHIDIIGNRFDDISAGAMMVDAPGRGQPFTPDRRSAKTLCEYIRINNNYITNIGIDYKSASAISIAVPQHVEIRHNEIAYIPYTGVHVSWGWANYPRTGTTLYDVHIDYNYIHDTFIEKLNDGANIYVVGASSIESGDIHNKAPNNTMFGNYLTNSWTASYIYPDDGTTRWHIRDNVGDASMVKELENDLVSSVLTPWFLHIHTSTVKHMTIVNNFATHDYAYKYGWMNGLECEIEPLHIIDDGNWPDEAKAIMANAGIEPEYQGWFDDLNNEPAMAIATNRAQAISLERPYDAGIIVVSREHGKTFPITDYEIDWWIDDPEAITMDENGFITAHKNGVYEAVAAVTVNGHTYLHNYRFEAGNEILDVKLNTDIINIVNDSVTDYQVLAYNSFGTAVDVTYEAKAEFVSNDTNIVKIRQACPDGIPSHQVWRIYGLAKGSTTITGHISYEGFEKDLVIPVNVVTYGSEEALTLPYRNIDLTVGWKIEGAPTGDGGAKISGKPNHYIGGAGVNNELIAFDFMCEPGHSWPAFSLLEDDMMRDYKSNSCYLVGFRTEFIELQKFVGGERTLFFGDPIVTINPLAGPGVPYEQNGEKIFEYGKRYSVIVGAIEGENGTRIVLTINGKNILDYTDTTPTRVKANKKTMFSIYNPGDSNGGFTFWPYSGIGTDTEE